MKRIVLILITVFGFECGNAQSKLIVTMLQQIAANAAHIKQIEQGISIVQNGLDFIGNAKNGEFNLHSLFFASLQSINPKIKNWAKFTDIITLPVQLLKNYHVHYKQINASGQFTAGEMKYIFSVFEKLTVNTAAILEELITITTADKYQMSDDGRIQRIDHLYRDMQGNFDFEEQFGNETLILAIQRKKETDEITRSRLLNNLK